MRKQGNQKHLTFEQRVDIEKGLTENKSFAEIAKLIGKDPSTVSKEVRRHSHEKERPDAILPTMGGQTALIQIHPARTEKAAR